VELDFDTNVIQILGKRLYNGYCRQRGECICVVTFFHNDDDMAKQIFDGNTEERRLELKQIFYRVRAG
jgi:hypothetical protein